MAASRRDEILALAAEQFAERGVAGTTVRDIGTAAGILSGSLYHHFTSKDQMVAELLLPVMERQVGHYRAIVGADEDAAATLRALIKVAVVEAAETPNQTRVIRNDSRALAAIPELQPTVDLLAEAGGLWASVVDRGIATGEFRDDVDARLVVAAMFDAVLSATRWFAGKRPQSPDRVGDALADLFLGGLASATAT